MTSYQGMTRKVNQWLARAHSYAPAAGDIPPRDVLDHMDVLIVAADLAIGHCPGTQVDRFRKIASLGYQLGPQPALKPSQRIRVLVNGQGAYCRVRDVCSADVLAVVEKINAERIAGRPTIGLLTRVRDDGPSIQVDVI